VDTAVKSAFRLDLLSFIGIPVQAQEQRLTNVPASGKLVHEKKTPMQAFLESIPLAKRKILVA
jgi:hypothetical protein